MATPTLFTSNRLELLARDLAQNIRAPVSSPFSPEIIVVKSQSMDRWLRLELAREHGISANYQFFFPEHFALWIFLSAFPEVTEQSPFESDSLVWVILKTLPELLGRPEFAPLKHYLGGDGDARKLYQLSHKIGRLFDHYLIFRPEMILEWDGGKGEGWQPVLWRKIAAEVGMPHPAALQKMFRDMAMKPGASFSRIPERISVFGVSAMPKFYLEIFELLAPHAQVDFYLLQPCAQWWGYISSDRETQKSLQRLGQKKRAAAEFHFERGNRLLASLGQQGREFLNLLHGFDWTEQEHSEDIVEDSLLHCVQADIFQLNDRGVEGSEKTSVASDDDSIRIHNCHSPLREMEVLQDHLLDWFQRDPTLTPRDIVVMTPDIETYAPFIRAVFESPEQESHRIPISIADCGARSRSAVIETFLKILGLPQTRLGAAGVLSILEVPAVREKFGLTEGNLGLIRSWVEKTNIRWGKDAAHRAALGLPEIADHTWQHGLNRLLLGYALAGNDIELCNGILPFDDIEGDGAIVLGRFADFLEKLFATVEELQSSRSLSGWSDFLRGALEMFFQAREQLESEFQFIRNALADLSRNEALSGFDGDISLEVVLEPLTHRMNEDRAGSGYLTGGVTFCALKPARSIPFKIICLVGMNDNSFPRTDSWLSFDLTAQNPRLGDRSSREDDRYLFLETLISAREKLYISYTGQSIRDNSPAPPSVLVSQLLDYLDQGFTAAKSGSIGEQLVTQHRLQAFSRDYFSGGPRFSYSRENFNAGQSVRSEKAAPPPFLEELLPEPEADFRQISIESLADFICHPARYFAIQRLGIYLPRLEAPLQDSEPFALEGLTHYKLKQRLLELRVAGHSLNDAVDLFHASGDLPPGLPGDAVFGNVRCAVEGFYSKLQPHLAGIAAAPRAVELALGKFQVSGQLKNITGEGLLSFRCADVNAKDLLRAWIHHLAANAASGELPRKSVLIGSDGVYQFCEVGNSPQVLESILEIYWRGMRQPLRFFPKSSLAFYESKTDGRKEPLAAARKEWEGREHGGSSGEGGDGYFALFFRNVNPFSDEFAELAGQIFQPLLAHVAKTDS